MHPRIYNRVFLGLVLAFAIGGGSALSAASQTCGGFGNLKCPEGQTCLYDAGQCKAPDPSGTCTQTPDICSQEGPPVCACDGTTYTNQCELLQAGAMTDHEGKCTAPKNQPSQALCAVFSPRSS